MNIKHQTTNFKATKNSKPKNILRFIVGSCLVVCSLLFAVPAALAVPQYINYQGVLRDSAGDLVTGSKAMVFNLYDVASGGTAVWTMTSAEVTVSNGLYTVQLGPITSTDVGDGDRWLEVVVAGTTLTPRLKILSVAYAITADTASYAALSGTASNAADAELLDGYNTGVSGLSIIPTTDATTGKLSTAVIPSTGVNVATADTADYATLSGSASTAATVSDNAITSAKILDETIVSADIDDGTITGTDIDSETITTGNILDGTIASGDVASDIALQNLTFNTLLASRAANMSGGTGQIDTGGGNATDIVSNSLVTANSIIILTVGHAASLAGANTNGGIKVSGIDPSNTFTVSTMDGLGASANIPFSYLIIN